MKTILTTALAAATLCTAVQAKTPAEYLSLKLEMERSVRRGNAFLLTQQDEEGFWSEKETPALTALVLAGILRDPGYDHDKTESAQVTKAFTWLLAQQKDDGGIYVKGLASYNTSSTIMALLARGKKEDEPALLKARKFLVNQQTDWGNKGETDDKYDGGTGYGGTYPHSDLSNTYLALEALYHSRHLAQDSNNGKQPELDWGAALKFVSRCQNLTATNDQITVTTPEDDGGLVYFPGNSKAGETKLPDGRIALRSYGSMSYAGLLSFIYADLDKDDPRVKGVLKWLGRNYTLKENPGLGPQGLYYYYHAMTKSLVAAGINHLELADGSKADWRKDLGRLLVGNQGSDGSWINENSRWWENDEILVSSYVVMTLEQLYHSIPE
ncbi:MAG: terpene cyclase/mutase family protein [Roseibacillus sp.]|jgi:squalene-hopene/tetraprenyl-beta-curcumene cyclase|nr:terpene cyclase/mutase family protein [Roseibacillus sp.]